VPAESFDVLAASLRADARDVHAFLEALAVRLEGAFPDSIRIDRDGMLGRGQVRAIQLEVGTHRYRLTARKGRVTGGRAQVVRGVVLKNEDLDVGSWIEALSNDLEDAARTSEREREALGRLLTE
jgi:hypothetical protein